MTLSPRSLQAEPRHVVHALDAAQAVLDRQGWRNNSIWSEDTDFRAVCLHEAILRSMTARPWAARAIHALSKTVAPDGRGTSLELIGWNDARGRTKAHVDALIARVREAHQ